MPCLPEMAVGESKTADQGRAAVLISKKPENCSESINGMPAAADQRDAGSTSPVTPAAVDEHGGSPALRWKSYAGKSGSNNDSSSSNNQMEPVKSSRSAPDHKGKLVINLCGVPHSLAKLSPASPKEQLEDLFKSTASGDNPAHGSSKAQKAAKDSLPAARDAAAVKIARTARRFKRARCRLLSKAHLLKKRCEGTRRERKGHQPSALSYKEIKDLNVSCFDLEQGALASDEKQIPQKSLDVKQAAQNGAPAHHPANQGDGDDHNSHGTASEIVAQHVLHIETPSESNAPTDLNASHDLSGNGNNTEKFDEERATMDAAASHKVEMEEYAEEHEPSGNARQPEKAYTCVYPTVKDEFITKPLPGGECIVCSNNDMDIKATSVTEHRDDSVQEVLSDEVTVRDSKCYDEGSNEQSASGRGRTSIKTHTVAAHDNGTMSETSKLETREQTLLETLLPDEPPGYSSAGGSEPSHLCGDEKLPNAHHVQSENSESDGASGEAHSDEYDSYASESEESDDDDDDEDDDDEEDDDDCSYSDSEEAFSEGAPKQFSPGTPRRGGLFSEQVPSVLCDAEGNVWHIGKRAEQARGVEATELKPAVAYNEGKEKSGKKSSSEIVPYRHQIQLNWKWPTDADYTISTVPDLTSRSMIVKERSVFVGCIPDGIENLEEILQSLMEKFLERFDFAPAILGGIQVVKVVKDFAFLELATEKVAHIVLAANQLDVFEWGVNGYHFNIEGCNGTHTSVRPLIEYMPLKPARIIFVGNIPKSRWQKEYLEAIFSRLIRGSDGSSGNSIVVESVYLLPESCDAYLELASELMADSLIFKCTKNPLLLREIGDDVFICRDASSVPLMSRHKGTVCPQRSLFIGVSPRGEEFKIDCVRKVFDEIVPIISRKTKQAGYIEYVALQPGKDYAFFQFNSEALVDAIMDEYIEDTQLFACKSSPTPYIILRPPGFVRPGAKYRSDSTSKRQSGSHKHHHMSKGHSSQKLHDRKSGSEKLGSTISLMPRKFGDEPTKKPDCIMSVGASPVPLATWNGLSFLGACSADPDCMLIVEGLPKGLSYKLIRGALNELFERYLCRTGLLEVGMLLVRYLDRDGNLDVVASLPNARLVHALLSARKPFVLAGQELQLLCKDQARKLPSRGIPGDLLGGQGDLSCLSDDEATQGRMWQRGYAVDRWTGPTMPQNRKERYNYGEGYPVCESAARGPSILMKSCNHVVDKCGPSEVWRSNSPLPKQVIRPQLKREISRPLASVSFQNNRSWNNSESIPALVEGINPRGKIPLTHKGMGLLRSKSKGLVQVKKSVLSFSRKVPNDVLKIVSKEGRREVQGSSSCFVSRDNQAYTDKGKIMRMSKKRKKFEIGQVGPVLNSGLALKKFIKRPRFL